MCYYGENTFNFIEGLNIILGANGYGKSKLFDAFQWVFNNSIIDPQSQKAISTSDIKSSIVSEKAMLDTEIGEKVETKVIIEVKSNRGEIYKISRKYFINKKSEKEWIYAKDSKLEIFKKNVIEFILISKDENEFILESLIKSEIRPYVWFQGERGISKLINTENDEDLKDLVKNLSNVDRWDTYIKVVEKAYSSAENDYKKKLREARKTNNIIATAEQKRDELLIKIKNKEEEIYVCKVNLQKAEDIKEKRLVTLETAKATEEIQRKKDDIINKIRTNTKESEIAYRNFNKKMFTNFWVLKDCVKYLEQYTNKYSRYEELKKEMRVKQEVEKVLQTRLPTGTPAPKYLEEMLQKEHCLVCDRKATKGTSEYKAIEALLKDAEPKKETSNNINKQKNLTPLFRTLYHNGLSIRSNIVNISDNIKGELSYIRDLDKEHDELEKEYEKLNSKWSREFDNSIKNPRDVINDYDNASNDINTYNRQLGRYEEQLKVYKSELIKVEAQITDSAVVPTHIEQKKNLLKDLVHITKNVKEKQYHDLMSLLETKTNEHYENINKPTGAFYGKVVFKGDYKVGYRPQIINTETGKNIISSLNTSVISSMKLATIMAVMSANSDRKYNDFYPLIADAPVSDFDVLKTKSFLLEAARTFTQSIIIIKELLIEDKGENHKKYTPDFNNLRDLKVNLLARDHDLKVSQLVLTNENNHNIRSQIAVQVKPINI